MNYTIPETNQTVALSNDTIKMMLDNCVIIGPTGKNDIAEIFTGYMRYNAQPSWENPFGCVVPERAGVSIKDVLYSFIEQTDALDSERISPRSPITRGELKKRISFWFASHDIVDSEIIDGNTIVDCFIDVLRNRI